MRFSDLFCQIARVPRLIRLYYFKKMGSVEILFFPRFDYILLVIMRVTPSLPQRGRQREGVRPLDPRGIFTTLLRAYPDVEDARAAGAEASDAAAPKSGL